MTGAAGFDTSVPNQARVYDCWLGGKDNFAADRETADAMAAVCPALPVMAAANRRFITAAVRAAAQAGIAQFADLGCGLPPPPPFETVHGTARAVLPSARVAYVDRDPVAVSHAQNLLAGNGVAAAAADLADPDQVLDGPDVRTVIDPGEPVAVLLGAVLHFYAAGDAAAIVRAYRQRIPAHSWIVISAGHVADPDMLEALRAMYGQAGAFRNHSAGDIAWWLDGMEVVEPGITSARRWAGWHERPWTRRHAAGVPSREPAFMLCGAGVKLLRRVTSLACEAIFPGGEGRFLPGRFSSSRPPAPAARPR